MGKEGVRKGELGSGGERGRGKSRASAQVAIHFRRGEGARRMGERVV